MFYSSILVVFVLCREVELSITEHDKLEFWTGYTTYEARRTNVEPKNKNTTNQNEITQFRFKKIKGPNGRERKNKTSIQLNNVKNSSHLREDDLEARFRGVDRNRGHEEGDKKKWPKIQQYHFRNKENVRSTRMTPLYLMQQEDDEKTTQKGKEEYNADLGLSPYSIKNDMLELANKFPEANISLEVIGRTAEYNDIVMLKVAERKSEIGKYFRADESKYIDEVPEKKIIFIVHGLSIMGLYLMPCLEYMPRLRELISYYFEHLDKFDIFLIPMANPDGFSMKRELWNKNMSPQGACSGVSLDRNFEVAWNNSHTVSSCSQQYPGPTPFSEPETRAIREVLHHYSHKIHAYFHVHAGSYSYSNFKGDAVLYPKGYTDVQSDDDKYIDLRGEIDEAMKNASFQVISVTVDTLHNWYGKVTGTSVDYASSVYGIPYALELVMQPYESIDEDSVNEDMSTNALREIWKRVIDVIFKNIWRSTKNNEVL